MGGLRLHCRFIVAVSAFALSSPIAARADRGALTASIGAGPEIANVPAPYTRATPSLLSYQFGALPEVRYALQNWLEVELAVLFEAPTTYWFSGADVVTRSGSYPGTLRTKMWGLSPHVGGRLVLNHVWRPVLELDAGLSARRFSQFQAIDAARHDYLLGDELSSLWVTQFLGAVGLGLEWAPWTPRALDHLSVSLVPRLQVRLASSGLADWAVLVPLTVGWSWYR